MVKYKIILFIIKIRWYMYRGIHSHFKAVCGGEHEGDIAGVIRESHRDKQIT